MRETKIQLRDRESTAGAIVRPQPFLVTGTRSALSLADTPPATNFAIRANEIISRIACVPIIKISAVVAFAQVIQIARVVAR